MTTIRNNLLFKIITRLDQLIDESIIIVPVFVYIKYSQLLYTYIFLNIYNNFHNTVISHPCHQKNLIHQTIDRRNLMLIALHQHLYGQLILKSSTTAIHIGMKILMICFSFIKSCSTFNTGASFSIRRLHSVHNCCTYLLLFFIQMPYGRSVLTFRFSIRTMHSCPFND